MAELKDYYQNLLVAAGKENFTQTKTNKKLEVIIQNLYSENEEKTNKSTQQERELEKRSQRIKELEENLDVLGVSLDGKNDLIQKMNKSYSRALNKI